MNVPPDQSGARIDGPPPSEYAAFSVPCVHRVRWTRGLFEPGNPVLADVLRECRREGDGAAPRAAVFLDSGVAGAHPALAGRAVAWADASGVRLGAEPCVVQGGEECKNNPAVLRTVLERIHAARLCRRSYAIVIGGGAVLDCVGFAAATAHRGIRLIRVPSTTLSQGDSAAGVKNGVNLFGTKNYLGTFAVPDAVICDEGLLRTLPGEHWRAGYSEAVKVAVVKDPGLFEQLERSADAIAARDHEAGTAVLRRSLLLHLRHITSGGDPFETLRARPLDFGHWAAHRLEHLSGYTLSHGDAVAIGIAVDNAYAFAIGLLGAADAGRVGRLLARLGFDLGSPLLRRDDEILAGLEEFREHLGGELTITLLRGIGEAIDVHTVDTEAMRSALRSCAR